MSALVAAHACAATVALLLGARLLLRRRKGDVGHRRLGLVWVVTMYGTVISSFWIRSDGSFSWIHGLSVLTFCSLTVAVWAAVTRRRQVHRDAVVGSYLGLLGAFVGAVAPPERDLPQLAGRDPGLLLVGFAGCALLAWTAARLAERTKVSARR
jgi:uncharacterized membrane protein